METSEITISWECWPAAGLVSPGLHSLHLLRYWRQGGRLGGMIIGSYLLLTLSWHSETSNCESKYSLHQENLPIMMGAGHYCDQLSHRSGKWDVINVAVNNNIRIYCGNLPHQLKSDLTRPLGSHYRHTEPPQPGTVPTLPVAISLNSTNALIVKQRTKRISEVSYRLFARHFCIFYLYLFSYQYL